MHSNAAAIFAHEVAELEQALNGDEVRLEAAKVLRTLIEKIVLTSDADALDSLAAELHGALAPVLASAPAGAKAPA